MNLFLPVKKPGFFKTLLTALLLLSGTVLSAQNKRFTGTVTDISEKTGIPNVTIVAKGSGAQTMSTRVL